MNKNQLASEVEFLRYFFDQANITSKERLFLEEGFELCFGKSVPEHLKIKVDEKDTDPAPPPAEILEEIKIPKPPRAPSLKELLIDNTEKGDYILMHKGSGEHMSLSILITQLKEMTGTE